MSYFHELEAAGTSDDGVSVLTIEEACSDFLADAGARNL